MPEFSCPRARAGYGMKLLLPIYGVSALRRKRLPGGRPKVNDRQEEVACL